MESGQCEDAASGILDVDGRPLVEASCGNLNIAKLIEPMTAVVVVSQGAHPADDAPVAGLDGDGGVRHVG